MSSPGYLNKKKSFIFILIILIAFNLRAPITGVGSLVNIISDELALTPAMAGSLTTIPVLAFAAVSPFAVLAAQKMGAGNLLSVSLMLLNLGIIVRSFCGNAGLFIGTAVVGLGIGVGNVLLPAVIRTYYPERIPLMTSIYTAVMQIISGGSTAISVPLAMRAGWNWSLSIWIITALAALLFCIPCRSIRISARKQGLTEASENKAGNVYRSAITWWVTLYMGVQSMIFYSFIAWLSPVMQDRGYDPTDAGYILSIYVVMGILGSCALPVFVKYNKTQSSTGIQIGFLYTLGILGMIFGKTLLVLIPAISICGFCSGTCISFVMALFGLHTSNGEDASKLSGTAQSIGYLLAATGPVMLGKLYDVAGGWILPLTVLLVAAVLLIFLGKIAGRDEII